MQCILWVKYILERTIDQHPKAFVYDLVKFRSQLGKWDAFVSGAFALNYFLNALQWTSQIDIHISAGDNYEGFLRYLQSTEKYYPYIVNLIVADDVPVCALLHGSYTTACLNIITWNKTFCLFPRLTLARRKMVLLKKMDDSFGKLLPIYERLGLSSGNILWPYKPPGRSSCDIVHPCHEEMLAARRVGP
ncbi:hypothetical protein TESG_00815 [Trichophyton tonsurans CBS 112818]|uniref:Uncharacterized protein n=1 Tax=Trichophyton tonsurans (strain CBS 112818) TaxID=647933 RepID=F2RPN3_TRIT1|nr:hypothetical protein TESG_00815 [Trichophyton tonsurans CBS 112818]